MRNYVVLFSIFFTLLCPVSTLYAQNSSYISTPCGNGTEECPYHIKKAGELVYFAAVINGTVSSIPKNESAYAVLDNDIDLSSVCGASIGTWTPIGAGSARFRGVFDGQNHSIKNLYISASTEGQGLFGLATGAEIKNVTISSGSISSTANSVGGIVGVGTVTIYNCHNYATITSSNKFTGGIIGYAGKSSLIENCHNEGNITGTSSGSSDFGVGGIGGAVSTDGIVRNCYNLGNITGSSSRVGGIVGSAENCLIDNCFSYGDVESKKNDYGGGLCAIAGDYSKTKVQNSYFYNNLGNVGQQPSMERPKSDFSDGTILSLLQEQSADTWIQTGSQYPTLINIKAPTSGTYTTTYETICQGESFVFNGKVLTEEGIYYSESCSCGGDTLILSIKKSGTKEEATICQGESILFNGQYITEAGKYIAGPGDCSDDTLIVTLIPSGKKIEESICQGESYTFDDQVLTTSGIYIAGPGDCSDDTLVLTVNKPSEIVLNINIFEGESFELGTEVLTEPGVYNTTIANGAENGCDSIITLNLRVKKKAAEIVPRAHMTPNGDGIDDVWIIENIDQFPEATIRIYNRWGKLLFETKGYDNENNAWNGTYLDADCPTSDYWYIIDIESIDMQMTGHFTLTR